MSLISYLLTVSLIIFIIYNLNIIELNNSNYITLLLSSYIVTTPMLKYEFLGIPLLIIFLTLFMYLKTLRIAPVIISICLSFIIFLFIDFLCGTLMISALSTRGITNIRENLFYYILFYFLLYICSYFICRIFNKYFFKKTFIEKLKFNGPFIFFITLSLLLTLMIFYTNSVLFFKGKILTLNQLKLNMMLFLLYAVLLILIFYTIYKVIKKESEFINRKNEFENLKEYTQNVESLYNEIRKFKHDYINILSSMSDYIEQNDMKGLKKHFENNILSLSEDIGNRNFKLGLLQNIKISELKGIISSKVIMASKKGIDVHIDILEPIEYINMNIIDLCRVLGILLDNAIEASENTPNKYMELGLINKKSSIMIVIGNSYEGDIPPIFKIYENGFSTKSTNRGLGLSNLKEILSLYNNTSLDTFFEDSNFVQVLEIYD